MNVFKRIKAELMYYAAVLKANDAHAFSGERYYVAPTEDKKLAVVDRKNFRELKRKHYIDKTATVTDLQKECFYCTPHRNGSGAMPVNVQKLKKEQFLHWFMQKTKKP